MVASVAERLAQLLQARGESWPGPIEHVAEVGSTNDELKRLCRAGAPDWSVLLADRQTRGRGRQGRVWASPADNLYFSLLLRPPLSPAAWGVLPLAAGLAVFEAASEQGVPAQLKWPNDVLVRGRKLAGILVEATSGPDGLEQAIVGVGLNANVAPADAAQAATSLRAERGGPVDVVELAAAVLARLSVCYHALARDGPAAILPRWRAGAAGWLGQPVEVQSAGGTLRGVARDVDEQGALLVEQASGRVERIFSGEARETRLGEP
jgi:BirA family biotin operon repressor/biotin-[acetyl-CoA-carboxylase] ligase